MYLDPPKTVEILDFFASINVRLELLQREKPSTLKMKFYVHGETVVVVDGNGLVIVSTYGNGANVNSALKEYSKRISNTRIRYRERAGEYGYKNFFYVNVPKLVHTKTIQL